MQRGEQAARDAAVNADGTAALGMTARRSLLVADSQLKRRKLFSHVMTGMVALCTVIGVVILWLILGYVIVRGAPAMNAAFFTERPLPFGEVGGGVAPAIMGSLQILGVACLVGIPVGVLTAIYLVEFGRNRFADAVRFVIDLLAGLPSIVVGVFIWALLVQRLIGNYAGLAGAAALAVIMIPIITRTVEAILLLVPNTMREASLALGVPSSRTILKVVLPAAKSGIITGVVLSMARAGGETAPLLLTTLGNTFISYDMMAPMAALPVQIYNYSVAPYADWHTKAWGSALVLITIIGLLSLLTRWAVRGKDLG
jgi:phosphate transport system permease protein